VRQSRHLQHGSGHPVVQDGVSQNCRIYNRRTMQRRHRCMVRCLFPVEDAKSESAGEVPYLRKPPWCSTQKRQPGMPARCGITDPYSTSGKIPTGAVDGREPHQTAFRGLSVCLRIGWRLRPFASGSQIRNACQTGRSGARFTWESDGPAVDRHVLCEAATVVVCVGFAGALRLFRATIRGGEPANFSRLRRKKR
jgi:hypothetical protein